MSKAQSVENRLWSKINKTNTCWIWTGAATSKGKHTYGVFILNYSAKKYGVAIHRYMWELNFGKVPKKKYVMHKCKNYLCVNPKHLYLGTRSQISKEMRKHDLSPEQRIWNKVRKINKPNGCWLWIGNKQCSISINRKYTQARRYVYLLTRGKINENLQVHNTCRNLLCVNPEHLYQVGDKINELKCTACAKIKPISEFSKSPSIGTHSAECRPCVAIRNRKRIYKLTNAEFLAMKKAQNNKCAICKKRKKLCVDHDHHTGVVRGLLCHACNLALGGFGDLLSNLKCAVRYLTKAPKP